MKANNMGTIRGRLARDPEQKGGGAVTTFTVAVDGWNGKTKEKETDFIRVVAFGKLGETVFNYCQKGKDVTIGYHLKPRSWEDPTSGQKRTELSVIADDIVLGADSSRAAGAPARRPAQDDEWGGFDDPQDEDLSLT